MRVINLKIVCVLFSMLVLFGCASDDENKSNPKLGKTTHLKIDYIFREKTAIEYLERNHLVYLNDTAKWYLYNIYYNYLLPKSIPRTDTSDKIYLAYLELIPIDCHISPDSLSIDILYAFVYNDSITVQNYPINESFPIANGVRIDLKEKKIENYILHGGIFKIISKDFGFGSSNQAEMISFITRRKERINLWYRTSLLKHNIKF